jgi:protocatechuate 3,4-dioxygenase beta subunit
MHNDEDDLFNRGLQFDVSTLIQRRALLGLIAGVGLAGVVGCSPGDTPEPTGTTPAGTTTNPTSGGTANTTREIPEETAGPYPGDGSNGPNVLTRSGIVRGDIRSSLDPPSTVAGGVPLVIDMTVLDLAAGGPLAGGAVYVWHCDREGRYSMYSPGVTGETYLRGIQETDGAGRVRFTTVFPGCYAGRWPHVHFEVYPSLASATSAGNTIATSQIAFPRDTCQAVYGTGGYEQSSRNLAGVSLETDGVFRDGWTDELGTVTGSLDGGLTIALPVPVRQ